MTQAVQVSTEVRDAVRDGRPVLALESTILTHGLPRPANEELALETEERVRAAGVIPATIGLVDGVPTVGLSTDELVALSRDDRAVKASLRDVPIAMAKGLSAGTTVAATAYLAVQAGVRVFSTGGLGGVHRGAAHTFDESADLGALAELPLVVVSAGVKSILDIGLTLERLETLGLSVVGYGTTDYPGFYVADSGFDIEYAVGSADEVARIATARDALGVRSTLLVANPVPAELQLSPELHDRVLAEALAAADSQGVHGHDSTPFLLDYFTKSTGGESMAANLVAYRGNVDLGAQVALALQALSGPNATEASSTAGASAR
ncbi:pseudouridine-5'-phosphate glycosidase [Leucobacter luti]|uniref:pseudouridine-5'-phosphate glycosidase n=1 Tax=Leucobacter luti TaxID=340320 RepID=UPI001043FFC9|nr:pseudouridine-5'-phosphate glycosidase [Leucobacter luti]MCW2288152.1 pseudouridine-5'-phosphate glycosidase [Leucobacter luti]TCK45686.1 pseudouridine-5'-phosphate glycosidase [Leucobacter luti]